MKKKIQSQINSLAENLLSDKNSLDTAALKEVTKQLYEKLVVLDYLESQIKGGVQDVESQSMDSKSFREEHWFKEPEQLPQAENKEELAEPLMEKIKDLVAQMPEESQNVDDLLEEILPKGKYIKNDLEEFASQYQETPTFERKEIGQTAKTTTKKTANTITEETKPTSINDKAGQGLAIGLNDRLAFIKQLFDGKEEDYTRVLSQINTMKSFDQADTFIKGKVKPDYNYWLNKDEFSERFMSIIEKNFN